MANQQASSLPPDVLFAQKASAVVKAAGLDPRAMDLEKFRQMAPAVFARAYEAIYNESIVDNANSTFIHEQATNSQIIIDGLIQKTGNPALSGLKGRDVCDGSHRAIGVLVGVLFAEGQRLWLEKLQKGGASKKKKKVKKVKKVVEDNVTQSILPSNDDPSSRMMKRIIHIKQQLASNDDAFVKEQSNNIIASDELVLKKKKARKTKEPQTDDYEIENVENPTNVRVYKSRPSSAPQTRRPLYPKPVKITDVVEDINARPQSPERKKIDNSVVQPFTYDLKSGRKIWLSQEQIDALEMQRRKAMLGNIHSLPDELDNNVEDESKPRSPKRPTSAGLYRREERPASPPARTEAVWPGISTEKSVDEWLRKMRRQRLNDENNNKVNSDLLRPRYFQSYNKMQMRDIVISIEHCHSCSCHNSTLRHDEAAYENQANAMLKNLAQIVHSCCVAVRVGVVRFKANITSKCKHSDSNTRIGAFEVQIAYRSPTGQIYPELLHSKLLSRNWPSKSVLEKRLKTYLSKLQIPTFAYNESNEYDGHDNEGIEPYPVGAGGWTSTKLAEPLWRYIPPHAETPKTTDKNDDDNDNNDNSKALQFIQWVYDSRKQSTLPVFSLGTTVSVTSITHPRGGTERHHLLAVIKAYPSSDNNMSPQSMVIVRLKYHSSEITVPVSNCDYLQGTVETFESIPAALEALLILAKSVLLSNQSKAIGWRLMDSEDKKGQDGAEENCIFLGRNSYFHQIRNLVWDLESSMFSNSNSMTVKHPKTGNDIDLQLAYSESQIDWVFNRFGKFANMKELEDIAVNGERKPEPEPKQELELKQEPSKQSITDVVPALDLTNVTEKVTKVVSSRPPQEPKSGRPQTSKVVKDEPEAGTLSQESNKSGTSKQDQISDAPKPESAKSPRQTSPRKASPTQESPTHGSPKPESARQEKVKQELPKPESARPESARPESARPESARPESARPESARPESARPESARPESARPESARQEKIKQESARAKPTTPRNDKSGTNSAPASSRKEESVDYENSGFEDYGDDFDEQDDGNNAVALDDTLNDRYAALMNDDNDDDDIDYNNL